MDTPYSCMGASHQSQHRGGNRGSVRCEVGSVASVSREVPGWVVHRVCEGVERERRETLIL